VALPVVPQTPGVRVERRYGDAGLIESRLRLAAIESCRIVDELHDVRRQPEILEDRIADPPDRGQRHQALLDAARYETEQGCIHADRERRRMRGAGERVQHVTDPHRSGVDQVECPTVVSPLVGDVVDRIDDEIDRHDVDPAAFDSNRWHPRRQELPHPLDQLEEVIRTIDLVHFAGLAVTDDKTWAIDPPGNLGLGTDDLFRIVLRLKVRVVEVLGLVEHVLPENTFVHPRRGNRADVLETSGMNRVRERHRIPRSVDVGCDLLFGIRRQVVDSGQMEEVLDAVVELVLVFLGYAEHRLRQVAHNRHRAAVVDAPVCVQCLDLLRRSLFSHQEVDDAAAVCEQPLDQPFPDEPGRAGDEIRHEVLPRVLP
jgi:hypothetical protein